MRTTAGRRAPTAAQDKPAAKPDPLQVLDATCAPVAEANPRSIGMTYWFDAAPDGAPYPVSIRFTGRRKGVRGRPGPADAFDVVRTIDRVVPGSGRVALTARAPDIAPGEWEVTAAPVTERRHRGGPPSARRPRLPMGSGVGRDGFAPLVRVRAPGVRVGAWPGLVAVGVVLALLIQGVLAGQAGLHGLRVLLVSVLAGLVGLVGAKVYYLALHRNPSRGLVTAGLCVQGFVLAAVATLLVGGLAAGLPVARLLDVTAPGLLLAMAVGRLGCFFGGCCVGRMTASRWGRWSSDRRVGARRIPTQWMEAGTALVLGLATLLTMVVGPPEPAGVVFSAGLAAYTLGRQVVFPLRDLPRQTSHGRTAVTVLAVAVLIVDLALGVIA